MLDNDGNAGLVKRLWVVAVFVALFAWVFADALFADRLFAFRDAAHFYYPLFQFIQDQWTAGRLPLVNPYENLGMPLAADAACSVFYPGKLIFFLPITYDAAYKIYIFAHVLLAAFWAYRLARHWSASTLAAGVCAIGYAFSGSVLLQYANVIYLVGAAWLPAALLAADRMARERRFRWAVALGVVLALMTLGGDPQMAYNAGLLAVFEIVWFAWRTKRATQRAATNTNHSDVGRSVGLLVLAAVTAFAIAAVQVIPSAGLVQRSGRAATETARSLYEIPTAWNHEDAPRRITDGLLCRAMPPDAHHRLVYHFSVGPWRLVEYLWPNCAGRQFPIHRRWLDVLPGEGRVWTPSLYLGAATLALALGAMRFRRGRATTRWLSWVVVLAIVASFGWYGPGWLLQEIRIAAGADLDHGFVGAPVGGLYWLMTVVLPGYVYFRYPAKLLVVAALGLSLLAARGWDEAWSRPTTRYRRIFAGLGIASLFGAVVSLAIRPWWGGWFADAPSNVLFGPLDAAGAANDLTGGFVQAAVVCLLGWWLLAPRRKKTGWAPAALLALVAIDLGVANGWMVATAPAEAWHTPSRYAGAIRSDWARRGQKGDFRVWRAKTWLPDAWSRTASTNRLVEAVRWDRDTLWPKYNLLERIAIAEVHGSMMPQEHREFVRQTERLEAMRLLGVRYAILPPDAILPGGQRLADDVDDAVLWYLPSEGDGGPER